MRARLASGYYVRIFLAPMEGVVDFHLRKVFAAIAEIDLCVTEFIRVNQHVMPRKVFTSICPELLPQNQNFNILAKATPATPIKVQLLGSDPHLLAANAKKAAALGAIGVDLNFGCPAKTVNKNRGGACLLDETDLLFEIVSEVRKSVPEAVPVSAKIRLGYNDRDSFLQNAKAIEAAGANEIAVHARSKADGYKPPAYWQYIGEIKQALSIPVIANGEIWTLDDYKQCKAQSACNDFMLGRGLLANPGLAADIRRFERGEEPKPLMWSELAPYLLCFFEETSAVYPKKYMGNRVKQWLHYLQRQFNEAEQLFERIKRERDYETITREIVNSMRV